MEQSYYGCPNCGFAHFGGKKKETRCSCDESVPRQIIYKVSKDNCLYPQKELKEIKHPLPKFMRKTIKSVCFYNDTKISKINLFENFKNLLYAILPKMETLPSHTFDGCTKLRVVSIQEGLKFIGYGCFRNCSSLHTINIPKQLVRIHFQGFAGCSSLLNLELPNELSFLGTECFSGCQNLREINIPGYLTEIRDDTFKNCYSLKTVKIPMRNVINIELNTFPNPNIKFHFEGWTSTTFQKFYMEDWLKKLESKDTIFNYSYHRERDIIVDNTKVGTYTTQYIKKGEEEEEKVISINLKDTPLIFKTLSGDEFQVQNWSNKKPTKSFKKLLLKENPELEGENFDFLFDCDSQICHDSSPGDFFLKVLNNNLDISYPIMIVWRNEK